MKKLVLIFFLFLQPFLGISQIKPLVVINELRSSVIVHLNQTIEGRGSVSSMIILKSDETSIMEVNDMNSTVTMQFEDDMKRLPVNNDAYKRQLKSSKGDCVVCRIDKFLDNPVSGKYYFRVVFKSGILNEYTNY